MGFLKQNSMKKKAISIRIFHHQLQLLDPGHPGEDGDWRIDIA